MAAWILNLGMTGPGAGSVVWTAAGWPYTLFYFQSTNWAARDWFLEVMMRAVSGTAHARLYDQTGSAAVDGSEVTTTGSSYARCRSGACQLTDGHEYRVQFGTLVADSGMAYDARAINAP